MKKERTIQIKVLVTKEERQLLKALSAVTGQSFQGLFNEELERLLKIAEERGLKPDAE